MLPLLKGDGHVMEVQKSGHVLNLFIKVLLPTRHVFKEIKHYTSN